MSLLVQHLSFFPQNPEGENQCVCLGFLAGFVLDLLLLSIGFDEKSSFKETDEANLQSKGAR